MEAHVIGLLILAPFVMVFAYAGVHEYRRYKSEGSATYGLVYDEETGTSYVTGISEEEEAYDPDSFDPSDYNEREDRKADDEDRS
jgi:hypothetical protein